MTEPTGVIIFDKLPLTISVLRINNKKVSLALFNQLPMIDAIKIPTENWWGFVSQRVPNESCRYWMVGHIDGVIYKGDTQIRNNVELTKMLSRIALDIKTVAEGNDSNRYDIADSIINFSRYGGSFILIQYPEYIKGEYSKEKALQRLKLLAAYLLLIANQPQLYISV